MDPLKETAERALQLIATGREQAASAVDRLEPGAANFTVQQMYAFDDALCAIEKGLIALRAVLTLASDHVVVSTELGT